MPPFLYISMYEKGGIFIHFYWHSPQPSVQILAIIPSYPRWAVGAFQMNSVATSLRSPFA